MIRILFLESDCRLPQPICERIRARLPQFLQDSEKNFGKSRERTNGSQKNPPSKTATLAALRLASKTRHFLPIRRFLDFSDEFLLAVPRKLPCSGGRQLIAVRHGPVIFQQPATAVVALSDGRAMKCLFCTQTDTSNISVSHSCQ